MCDVCEEVYFGVIEFVFFLTFKKEPFFLVPFLAFVQIVFADASDDEDECQRVCDVGIRRLPPWREYGDVQLGAFLVPCKVIVARFDNELVFPLRQDCIRTSGVVACVHPFFINVFQFVCIQVGFWASVAQSDKAQVDVVLVMFKCHMVRQGVFVV